jgi:pyrroline-5-carboxylate reductase
MVSGAAGPEVHDGITSFGEVRDDTRGSSGPRRTLAGMNRQLALLGGGRMGEALLGGLLDAGYEPDAIAVAEVDAERRRELEERCKGVRVVPSPAWAVADAEVVVVAVKPQDVASALEQAGTSLAEDALVISIAAGVTIAALEAAAPGRPVVRAMPNTPALVRRAATAIAGGAHATAAHLETAERVLGSVGIVVQVPEAQLDAVTGLSGSGPAYVFLVAEALIEAGVLAGLPRPTADALVRETLLGSAQLLAAGDDSPESLRAAVTSPGGTTAAGLHALEQRGVRAALLDAVRAATERSRQLGDR